MSELSIIQQIHEKVAALIEENQSLRIKNHALTNDIDALKSQLATCQGDLSRLNEEINNLQTAKNTAAKIAVERQNVKLRINDLVGEIDRCITLLNQ